MASELGLITIRTHLSGTQVAFVKNNGLLPQIWSASAGTYTLSFQATQCASGNDSYQQLRVNMRGARSTKRFVWSGNTIAEERDSTGANVTKRFFAEGEQRLGGLGAGSFYYSRDHLGSIRELTGTNGAVKGRYDYDAWGNQITAEGKVTADFGYTGHYFHQPSGMNLAMYRAYSPSLGRWISRDPIGEMGGLNLFGYVGNNPINAIDPLGLQSDFEGETNYWMNRGGMGSREGTHLPSRSAVIVRETVIDGLLTVGTALPVERVITLLSGLKDIVQFGKTSNQISHTFRHVEGKGLCKETVMDAISKELERLAESMPTGSGETIIVTVEGKTVIARAHRLENGVINVGRIVVKP